MTPRTKRLVFGALGLVLILIVLSPRLQLFRRDKSAAGLTEQDRRIPVLAVVLHPRKLVNSIHATGTLLANEEVDLRSEIAGKVERIFFREGSRIRRGELLVKINDDDLKAQFQKAESQKKLAEDREARRKQMLDKAVISPEDYEVALNELNSYNAEIELLRARLSKTELRAPFDGVIGLRYVSEGSYVSSSTRIAVLQDVGAIKIDFSVPEQYAMHVAKGQKVNFTRTGSPEVFTGRIFAVEPRIDPQTRTLQVRALSANPEGKLVPGAFAEIDLVLEEIPDALMVPTESLIPILQGHRVFTVGSGVAEQKDVRIGIRTDTHVQIVEGLQEGDTVITTGVLQLAPGSPILLSGVE
jgi:membrane fusion protein (multidrug efflux system)